MKTYNIVKSILLALGTGLMLSSCVKFQHDDMPQANLNFEPSNAKVMSLDELYGYYPGDFDSVGQFLDTENGDSIWRDIYLNVVVIGNDVSGNIYKSMYVRDKNSDRALNLSVDKTGLYNFYPEGQELYINCSGLYIGKYQGLPQLGFRYADDNGAVSLGRIPDAVFTRHIFKNGLPPTEPADLPQPIEITDASQLENPDLYNQLVLLRNVEFSPDDIGQEFSPAPPSGSNPISSDRIFTINGTGSGLTLRTSSACRFFRRPVPVGKGDMVCIYAIYGTSNPTKQFYLRQFSDLNLAQFDSTASLSRTLFYESFASRDHSFTICNVDEGAVTWTFGTYGGGCMMVQGNNSNKTVNEDWLISPSFTLDGDFNYYDLNFQYVLRYKSNSASDYTIRIAEDYVDGMENPNDADWETLPVSLVEGSDWSFRASNDIDLGDYKGKTVRIAFVYKSDANNMATWELNNVKVIGHQE